MKVKNYFILLITMIVGGLAFTACNDDDDDYVYYPQAQVQFVNAYPWADELGVTLGGNVARIGYGKYLNYWQGTVLAGTYNFSAGLPNTSTPIVDSAITLEDSTSYTSVIYGTEEEATSILVEDRRPSDFDQSKAYVRFFNLADNTVAMDVNLLSNSNPTKIFANRGYDNQTSATANQAFEAVDPGIFTIQFTDVNGTELAKREETVELEQGGIYTIIARGVKDNSETPLAVGFIDHINQQ